MYIEEKIMLELRGVGREEISKHLIHQPTLLYMHRLSGRMATGQMRFMLKRIHCGVSVCHPADLFTKAV